MDSSELSNVAWDVAEYGRPSLTVAELNIVFVRLGIGDYIEALETVLEAIDRTDGQRLPKEFAEKLVRLGQVQYLGPHVVDLAARVSETP
ncbi:hypothetical protein PDG61_13525 [Mycolicibacterium sp. BiH015]|uniref:hypothetical protein n=1 Tax=Mycolicibacterium sp. BiH015 TaxID=3018808 RepID=UPI0022DF958C|nr:hypothetical protein [Mycolicibacterium sp. BiH015]MDA2891939.1 hypothetical protein [Mycolicibacterium sp. BiH015]